MKKVFIDTNVFIRFFTRDDKQKYLECVRLFNLIEEGKIRPYISNFIVLEIQFVLMKTYKYSKHTILEDINTILSLRNLTLIEKSDTKKALALYKKLNIKYLDCLISTQLPKGTKLVSYDEEFAKIKTLTVATPKDLL